MPSTFTTDTAGETTVPGPHDITLTLTATMYGEQHSLGTAVVTPEARFEGGGLAVNVTADIADALTEMSWELGKDQTCGPVRGAGKYMAVTTNHLIELAVARDDARAERDKFERKATRLQSELDTANSRHEKLFAEFAELHLELSEQDQVLAKTAAERDKAYRDRAELIEVLARAHNDPDEHDVVPVIVHGADEEAPGWPVLYLYNHASGQMSWHINPDDMDLFEDIRQVKAGDMFAPKWDGHDDAEKSRRIAGLELRL